MKKYSLLAAAIVASTLSVPAFSMGHDTDPYTDFDVTLDLPDMILVRLADNTVEMGEGTISIDRLEALVDVSIEMRGATEASPRPYTVTVSQTKSGADGDFAMHHEEEGKPSIPLQVAFYPDKNGSGPIIENGVVSEDERYKTPHGITRVVNGKPDTEFEYDSMLYVGVESKDHMDALPGKYDSTLRLTVAAK
ncbi:hypothetical protein [Endozoicomonas sp. SCSIO W0465]|uniref:hypothetical protein n=1 Tax=Endozoicomonas sp. SCSIO W0465 TaxID=2918516 RepID=UPI002074D0D8|nr:hypothetical protein [Endozoicomonas sp. SCSIO W0465]USE36875.1 hypothetical protein MJO57_01110 [Endozoicomonas sp. SCSIO W0465]